MPALLISKRGGEDSWVVGRAGMRYRDLIPGRWGGRFLASNIHIPVGGLVPDAVHHHDIRFQMTYCSNGWVRVVYEDQGPPIRMQAGDCVLQPPHIRHRVLESSDDMEVVEIVCPAEHDTYLDHEMDLPTATMNRERRFGGQAFAFHVAADHPWQEASIAGWECRDIGIAPATAGLAGAGVLRPQQQGNGKGANIWEHQGEFLFLFLLHGSLNMRGEDGAVQALGAGDSLTLPAGRPVKQKQPSEDLLLLEIHLPA